MIDKFFRCACHGEGLHVSYDPEDKMRYITMWQAGYAGVGSIPWRQRFRHIWKILRTGVPWHDQVVLSECEAFKIAAFLKDPVV